MNNFGKSINLIYLCTMVIVKVTNCVFNGRKNQNTTFWFSEYDFGFRLGYVTEEWISNNIEKIKPNIKVQKCTKIKII